eukprot:jgi/Orpsp1_1/1192674/evm.model.d7180000095122.1
MKDLNAYNPAVDCDNLVAGTKLCLLPGDDFDISSEYGMNGTYIPNFDNSENVSANSSNSVENGKEYKCDQHVVVPEGGQCSDFIHRNDIPYVRMKDLNAYNPAVDCDNLVVGTKLCLLPGDDFDISSEYGMNGSYIPNFDNSEDVTTKSSNSVENSNGYECSKHIVVQEGEECSDYNGNNQSLSHIRLNDLLGYNPTLDCDNLVAGTKVCLEFDLDKYYEEFSSYTIEENDTLQSLSEKLNTSIEILRRLNGSIFSAYEDDETLYNVVGVEIEYRDDGAYVPDFSNSEELTTTKSSNSENSDGYECSKHIVVQEGEECSDYNGNNQSLSHIRLNDLLGYNPTLDCDNLVAGTKVCLEFDLDKYYEEFSSYTIEENDTLQSLSEKLNTSIEILRNINSYIFKSYEDDETLYNVVGVEIEYRDDGAYVPDFSNSEELTTTKSSNSENSDGYECSKHVVVQEGEECSDYNGNNQSLSHIRLKDLLGNNPTLDCDNLVAGTKVCLEFDLDKYYEEFSSYTIEENDTLQSLSEKLNTSIEILRRLNGSIFSAYEDDETLYNVV